MRHAVGIMQGRLSPMRDGRIQSFPVDSWEGEFAVAADLGFSSIELVLDRESMEANPLLTGDGPARLDALRQNTGVRTPLVCCDVFMTVPLAVDQAQDSSGGALLRRIIAAAARCRVPMLELPVIGPTSVKDGGEDALVRTLLECLPEAEAAGVTLLLETDLPPRRFRALLDRLGGRVLANYDTGNSTWFGFDQPEEIRILGDLIGNVHIKDCTRADYSVPLGTGETPFDDCFAALRAVGYAGEFILQAARMDDEEAAARAFLSFTRALIARHF